MADTIEQQQPTTDASQQQHPLDVKVEQQVLVANADGPHDTNTTAGVVDASDAEEWRNGICSHICGADDCNSCGWTNRNKDDFDLCNTACGILYLSFHVHLGVSTELKLALGTHSLTLRSCSVSRSCSGAKKYARNSASKGILALTASRAGVVSPAPLDR
ncbi:hypothetical protein LTR22_017290 [Elasticomyces elasticus]|nr:hypothetical protein LTR22_017290 [Elasticomyces elasticus]